MEDKTNFSRRLKQFDGLTWLTLTPLFYDSSSHWFNVPCDGAAERQTWWLQVVTSPDEGGWEGKTRGLGYGNLQRGPRSELWWRLGAKPIDNVRRRQKSWSSHEAQANTCLAGCAITGVKRRLCRKQIMPRFELSTNRHSVISWAWSGVVRRRCQHHN